MNRQLARRVDPPGKYSGEGGSAFFAGEEGLDDGRRAVGVRAEGVRAPGDDEQDDRRTGGEQGLDQFVLDAGQGQVLRIAALAGGAEAEQGGAVADHGDSDIGLFGSLHRRLEACPGTPSASSA